MLASDLIKYHLNVGLFYFLHVVLFVITLKMIVIMY